MLSHPVRIVSHAAAAASIAFALLSAPAAAAAKPAPKPAISDPSQFGEWIADVERPAERRRG